VKLRPATSADAAVLAEMHKTAFEAPWGEGEIGALLDGPGGFALIAEDDGPRGFILCRAIGGEAEVLTLAVDPRARRRGLGRALVQEGVNVARARGAEAFFLEVAEDNKAAIALYQALRFTWQGRRPKYYQGATDALIMRRRLNRAR
jgi:ribosomal-protein-alanine N-acetyltransferase